jgi:hypothetical protein
VDVSVPVEDDPENIILNAHVGVSYHKLMGRVGRGTANEHGEREELKSWQGLHLLEVRRSPMLGLRVNGAGVAKIIQNCDEHANFDVHCAALTDCLTRESAVGAPISKSPLNLRLSAIWKLERLRARWLYYLLFELDTKAIMLDVRRGFRAN